jgi:hypothetical protein
MVGSKASYRRQLRPRNKFQPRWTACLAGFLRSVFEHAARSPLIDPRLGPGRRSRPAHRQRSVGSRHWTALRRQRLAEKKRHWMRFRLAEHAGATSIGCGASPKPQFWPKKTAGRRWRGSAPSCTPTPLLRAHRRRGRWPMLIARPIFSATRKLSASASFPYAMSLRRPAGIPPA